MTKKLNHKHYSKKVNLSFNQLKKKKKIKSSLISFVSNIQIL